MNGFFLSKATYLLDIVSDLTSEESGSTAAVQRLQVKLNHAKRCVLKIPRKSLKGKRFLQEKSGLPCIEDLALRAECNLAWRLLADHGDMRDLAEPGLRLQDHGYSTRSATAGTLVQEDPFPSFIKKSVAIFNIFDIGLKKKENNVLAKNWIKKNIQNIKQDLKRSLCL
jgi:hypothetical protein